MLQFYGGIQKQPTGGGSADTLNLGNTLIVSKTGNDSKAAAESLNNHYLTISAALADAKDGDVVIVYAGNYNEFVFIGKDITLDLHKGAVISGDGIAVSGGCNAVILGGILDSNNIQQALLVDNSATLEIRGLSIESESQGIRVDGGFVTAL